MFAYKKYVFNMPCLVCASVKIHSFIVVLAYTAFKWNENDTISCE